MKNIRFYDHSYFELEGYDYWTDYTELENGNYKVSYGSTADGRCPCCGIFGFCQCTDDDYEQITPDNMKEIIDSFVETNEEWIEYKEI